MIYLVLTQDKSKLNAMMNVDYCKLLAHNIFNLKIVERRLYFLMLKKNQSWLILEEHCFSDTRDCFAYCRR